MDEYSNVIVLGLSFMNKNLSQGSVNDKQDEGNMVLFHLALLDNLIEKMELSHLKTWRIRRVIRTWSFWSCFQNLKRGLIAGFRPNKAGGNDDDIDCIDFAK